MLANRKCNRSTAMVLATPSESIDRSGLVSGSRAQATEFYCVFHCIIYV